MMSLSTTNAFDCEQECKKQQDCFFFNFSERDGVCELYESEFRHGCHDLSGPLDLDIERCLSTPSMSCERVMLTDCSFEDDNTTYISHWPKQKSPADCQDKCKI